MRNSVYPKLVVVIIAIRYRSYGFLIVDNFTEKLLPDFYVIDFASSGVGIRMSKYVLCGHTKDEKRVIGSQKQKQHILVARKYFSYSFDKFS